MHVSSLENMRNFRDKYLSGKEGESLIIMDIGSQSFQESYRGMFTLGQWVYTGVDVVTGENVDLVLESLYDWHEIKTDLVDVVISGQVFEHIEFFWLTMKEIARILKPGGLCCIIAPSGGPVHKYPLDCWRFFPDGFRALARYVGLEVLEARRPEETKGLDPASDVWADTVLVARKPIGG